MRFVASDLYKKFSILKKRLPLRNYGNYNTTIIKLKTNGKQTLY